MKINNFDAKTKKIINNFSYLTIIQAITLLSPFLYYPYLIRVIGPDNYGDIIIVQSAFFVFSLFIEFGFNIYGTKEIIKVKASKDNLERLVSNIIYSKLIMLVVVVFITYLFVYYIFTFSSLYKTLYLYLLPTLFYDVFFSQWYFQGVDKIKICAINNGLMKLFTVVCVFLFVKDESDGYIFAIILSLTNILLALLVLGYMLFLDKLKPKRIDIKYICLLIKGAFVFFHSKFFASCIIRVNVLLVGYTLGPVMVSFYDIASKITNLLLVPFYMLNQAIYPIVFENKNLKITKFVIYTTLPIGIIFLFVMYFYGEGILFFVSGSDFNIDNKMLFLFSLYLPFQIVSIFLGNTALVIFDKNKEFGESVSFGVLLYALSTIFIFIFFGFNIYSFIILLLIYTVAVFIYRFYFAVIKYKLFKIES
ncbi:TPA: oligosaccharide flippase family protein [Photobacterium damselae]